MKTSFYRFPRLLRPSMGIAIAMLTASLATAPAGAASIGMGTSAGIDISPPGDSQNYNSNQAVDLATTHLITSSASAFGSSSSGSVEAGAGVIRMFAASNVVDPLAHGLPGTSSHVTSQTHDIATITESVQVLSTTLAAGTPVDLLFGLSFAQNLTSSEALSSFLDGGYEAQFFAHDQSPSPTLILDSANITSSVMHTFIGQTIMLTETMFGGTYATYIDQTAKSIVDDATHSAHFFIDAQYAGVTLLSESGHDYASAAIAPVPEPSQSMLLLGGFALLGAMCRRRLNSGGAGRVGD